MWCSRLVFECALVGVIAASLLLGACDWTVDGAGAGGPVLLRVEQVPAPPVAPSDTVQIMAVLADTTDPTLRFEWNLALVSHTATTEDATVVWVAPDSAATYVHEVKAVTGVDTVRTDTLEFETVVQASGGDSLIEE